MVKMLTLLRHAKAVPISAGTDDHARPLNDRGTQAAETIGRQTIAQPPDLVLCSTSARTRQTIARVIGEWPSTPRIEYDAALYLASPADLLARLGVVDPKVSSVWLVGHNPGLQDLALHLANRAGHPEHAAHFPTAARACFRLDTDSWAGLATAPVALVNVIIPARA